MRSWTAWLISAVLSVGAVVALAAQEGHPLSGTWSGDWGPSDDKRTRITLVMNWDGKAVTGILNPGPDAMPLARVTVDYAKWTVRLESDRKNAPATSIVAEGRIDDLGSWHRTLSGTWTQNGVKGSFKLTRD
jgi:hypothetical protein